MGWNQGYEIMEATVIGAYDLGKLDEPLLTVLMEPYRDSDIDSGGSCGLIAKDGLSVEEVVLKTLGLDVPKKPSNPDYHSDEDGWDGYQEELGEAFNDATEQFGW